MLRILSLALVLVFAPAAAAATARDRQTPGPIEAVSIAGTDVGYADRYQGGCHEVRLWNVATRADRRLATHCFESTSTGSGVADVSASGGRALWITYTGGNIREWSLWTKRGTVPAKRLAFLPADVDGPAPVLLGSAWEGSLPYATGRTIIVLDPNGARRFSLVAADRVVALSAHTRGYAAVLADGHVLSISPAGKIVRDRAFAPGEVSAAVLAGPGLILKTRIGLEIHGNADVRTVPMARGSRFLGYSEGTIAYGFARQLRLMRLTGGEDRLFRRLEPRFHAQLGRRGVAYGSARTLGFAAWITL
jgi:hypothetical protein